MISIPIAEKISIIRLEDGRVMIKIPSSLGEEFVVSLVEGHTLDIWAMNVMRINLQSPEKEMRLVDKPVLYEGNNG